MILIWSGRGLFALLFLVTSLAIPVSAAAVYAASFPNATPTWLFWAANTSGLIVGGLACWACGRSWNSKVVAGLGHTLYFLPVEYWGILAWVGAAVLIARQIFA